MYEDPAGNGRLLARAYGTDPGLGLDPIIEVIIGRSSMSAVPSDRAAVRAVANLALTFQPFYAINFKEPVSAATLARMEAAAQACGPTRPAGIVVEIVLADIRRAIFPPPGTRPPVAADDGRSWASHWWTTHVRRNDARAGQG
jgi:hypothetical protein